MPRGTRARALDMMAPPTARRGPPPHAAASDWQSALRRHGALLALLLLAAPLLLLNLSGPLLWEDEADTAVFARSIALRGLPWAWDGTTFIDSDSGRRLTQNLLMVGTPWLPYYVTAASFRLFGETELAARLPFALAGWTSIALLYLLVLRASRDRRAALASAFLLLSSVQFLLYARECRYYALSMLLSIALLLSFMRLRRHPWDPWLVVVALLLYHCHPLPAAAGLGALATITLLHPHFRPLQRALWLRLPVIVVLALPWAFFSWTGWDEHSRVLSDASQLLPRLGQFAAEASVAVPLVGWLALLPFAWARSAPEGRAWAALVVVHVASYAALTSLLVSTQQLWEIGLRYACGMIPIAAGLSGWLVARAAGDRRGLFAGLLLILGATHLGGNTLPWLVAREYKTPTPKTVAMHVPEGLAAKLLRTEWLGFLAELREVDSGTNTRIIAFLDEHAGPGDVVVTNYAWEPLYFYTGLPQGLRVLPEHPIYDAARGAGLPDYVFEAGAASFVVWRAPWESYQGYFFADVARALRDDGARLVTAARFPETIWENRPELHFRRFPRVGYIYRAGMRIRGIDRWAEAVVYRVERNGGPAPGHGGAEADGALASSGSGAERRP
jgi:hypothetical protein